MGQMKYDSSDMRDRRLIGRAAELARLRDLTS
jgi:hypothetical protein